MNPCDYKVPCPPPRMTPRDYKIQCRRPCGLGIEVPVPAPRRLISDAEMKRPPPDVQMSCNPCGFKAREIPIPAPRKQKM